MRLVRGKSWAVQLLVAGQWMGPKMPGASAADPPTGGTGCTYKNCALHEY